MRTKKTILRRMTAAGLMLASALLLIIAGCRGNLGRTQTKASENSTWYKDTAALEALYQKAVDDASEPTPSKVVDTLMSITNAADNPDQEWIKVGDTDMVLVASLMKQKFVDMYRNEPDTFRLQSSESWFTVPSEWKKKAKCFAEMDSVESRTRLLQMLGLPLSTVHTQIVAVYVDAKALFRPSRDPEITDHTSQLSYPKGVSANRCPILRECRRTIMTGSSTTSRSLTSQEMLTPGHNLAIHTTGITPMDLTSASASLLHSKALSPR